MISIQRNTAEKLLLHFRGWPEQYGFNSEATEAGATVLHHMPFAVNGGYLQIFGPVIMIIAMSEIISIAFIPARGENNIERPLIAVE